MSCTNFYLQIVYFTMNSKMLNIDPELRSSDLIYTA